MPAFQHLLVSIRAQQEILKCKACTNTKESSILRGNKSMITEWFMCAPGVTLPFFQQLISNFFSFESFFAHLLQQLLRLLHIAFALYKRKSVIKFAGVCF